MKRKITISFIDSESLTTQEAISSVKAVYGDDTEVKVEPGTSLPLSHIKYGLSELLTEEQAVIFFDQPELYPEKLKELRRNVIKEVLYILNDVIMENESKFSS